MTPALAALLSASEEELREYADQIEGVIERDADDDPFDSARGALILRNLASARAEIAAAVETHEAVLWCKENRANVLGYGKTVLIEETGEPCTWSAFVSEDDDGEGHGRTLLEAVSALKAKLPGGGEG